MKAQRQRLEQQSHLSVIQDVVIELSNLKDKNNIEILLHAMNIKLLMRLKKQEISSETDEAFDTMGIQLANLVKAYHQMKRGTLIYFQN